MLFEASIYLCAIKNNFFYHFFLLFHIISFNFTYKCMNKKKMKYAKIFIINAKACMAEIAQNRVHARLLYVTYNRLYTMIISGRKASWVRYLIET